MKLEPSIMGRGVTKNSDWKLRLGLRLGVQVRLRILETVQKRPSWSRSIRHLVDSPVRLDIGLSYSNTT